MNDVKSVLAKKKELLEECKRRKKEREQQKLFELTKFSSDLLNNTNSNTTNNRNNSNTKNSSGLVNGSSSRLNDTSESTRASIALAASRTTGQLLKEFDNLSADEILKKCGINNDDLLAAARLSSSNHLTPSSSTISFSSSSNSIYSSNNNNNGLNGNNAVASSSSSNLHISNRLREDFIRKQLENLNLKPEVNLNKVDIFPDEVIKYDKEIQTLNSVLSPQANSTNKSSDNLPGDDYDEHHHHHGFSDHDDFDANVKKTSASNKTKKKPLKHLKPLAFYEDVFVYDTFQWEDEFTNGDHDDDGLDEKTAKLIENGHDLDHELVQKLMQQHLLERHNHHQNHQHIGNTSEQGQDSDTYDDDDIVDEIEKSLKNNDGTTSKLSTKFIDTNEFARFLNEKRPVVERALKQNEQNIYFDYRTSNDDNNVQDEENKTIIKFKKRLPAPEKFSNSIVTCLDWSQQHTELMLSSYDNMLTNYAESDTEAITALWNIKADQKAPLQIFTSTSLITSCIFSTYQSNLIIAGTFSGQIVMWDVRSNKRTPIQRSSLSTSSHVNPVYCLRIIGTGDSQNLVSISNDGKLCLWSLTNLNMPFDTQELVLKHATNKNVYASCMDYQTVQQFEPTSPHHQVEAATNDVHFSIHESNEQNDPNDQANFNRQSYAVIGAEDGQVHSFSTTNNKFTIADSFEDHFGPVTSVNFLSTQISDEHPSLASGHEQLHDLFLSSSFDSTVKLWNVSESTKPLYTFECGGGDYVFDVAWSPVHPCLFACIDGAGKLDLWNLNKNFETASASMDVDNRTRALNKLKWSRKGTEIAIGDDHGEVSIYEINECFAKPSTSLHDEYDNLARTLNTLKKLSQEQHSYANFNNDSNATINYLMDSYR